MKNFKKIIIVLIIIIFYTAVPFAYEYQEGRCYQTEITYGTTEYCQSVYQGPTSCPGGICYFDNYCCLAPADCNGGWKSVPPADLPGVLDQGETIIKAYIHRHNCAPADCNAAFRVGAYAACLSLSDNRCPEGYTIDSNGKCIEIDCGNGGAWDAVQGQCVCDDGYVLNSDTGKCELNVGECEYLRTIFRSITQSTWEAQGITTTSALQMEADGQTVPTNCTQFIECWSNKICCDSQAEFEAYMSVEGGLSCTQQGWKREKKEGVFVDGGSYTETNSTAGCPDVVICNNPSDADDPNSPFYIDPDDISIDWDYDGSGGDDGNIDVPDAPEKPDIPTEAPQTIIPDINPNTTPELVGIETQLQNLINAQNQTNSQIQISNELLSTLIDAQTQQTQLDEIARQDETTETPETGSGEDETADESGNEQLPAPMGEPTLPSLDDVDGNEGSIPDENLNSETGLPNTMPSGKFQQVYDQKKSGVNAAISGLIDVSATPGNCSIAIPVPWFGQTVNATLDFCDYGEEFTMFGGVLFVVCQLHCGLIMIGARS